MPVSEHDFNEARNDIIILKRDFAVRDERDKSVDKRLQRIENILTRLTGIVVTGLGGAFVAWIVNGGLSHVTLG